MGPPWRRSTGAESTRASRPSQTRGGKETPHAHSRCLFYVFATLIIINGLLCLYLTRAHTHTHTMDALRGIFST